MPDEKVTAVLVIHGVGEQNPFETLGQFVRGIWSASEGKYKIIQKTVSLTDCASSETWLQNYLELRADKLPAIDVYECYWAHYMTGRATIRDIRKWLLDASRYAKTFYAQNDNLRKRHEHSRFFKEKNYLKMLNWQVRLVLWLFDYLFQTINSYNLPVITPLLNKLIDSFAVVIVNYLGDVVVYTETDRKDSHFEIRRKIMKIAHEQIEGLVRDDKYEDVLVVGHSLGSVIAYNALSEINGECPKTSDGKKTIAYQKIKGLITFGSPLDKIAFFFRRHTAKEQWVRRQMLKNIYGYKRENLNFSRIFSFDKLADALEIEKSDRKNLRRRMLKKKIIKQCQGTGSYFFNDENRNGRDFIRALERIKIKVNYPDKAIEFWENCREDADIIEDRTSNNLTTELGSEVREVKWINFHDDDDPISGHLDFFKVDENIPLNLKSMLEKKGFFKGRRLLKKIWITHLDYWQDDEMYKKIRKEFFKPE